jgi:hypothetical protein
VDVNNLNEILARFLLSKTQYYRQRARAKPSAFLPHNGATSVFKVSSLSEDDIWRIGRDIVVKARDRRVHGRADLESTAVGANGLTIDNDDDPPGHANIVGWPSDKAKQKAIAGALAEAAALKLLDQS